MADNHNIEFWVASELRNNYVNIIVCYIRRRYVTGSEPGSRRLGTFLMVSQRKGFTMMLKDSNVKLSEGQPVEATLDIGNTPFTGFSAQVLGEDEIGIFPQHGKALAAVLEQG